MTNRHILVPVDFSGESIKALDQAVLLANKFDYNVRLIHVKRENADYDPSFNLKDFDEVLRSGARDNFDKLIGLYYNQINRTIDYKIREGRIYTEICNQAKYGDAEFIVMGTHGVSGFEERWVGSNAFRVVSNATCPVFTVRYNFPVRPLQRIVMPIDITTESRQKVPFVTELALTFDAEIHLVDVRENNRGGIQKRLKEYVDQVMQYLNRRKVKVVRESIKQSDLTGAIIEYALLIDADIIAIMTDQIDKSRIFLMGQYAQQMVNHSPIPILSFKVQ